MQRVPSELQQAVVAVHPASTAAFGSWCDVFVGGGSHDLGCSNWVWRRPVSGCQLRLWGICRLKFGLKTLNKQQDR